MRKIDDKKREEIAPRIGYEWDLLNWAYRQLLPFELALSSGAEDDSIIPTTESETQHEEYGLGTGGNGWKARSALLECFLLHVRVLRDFLTKPPSRYDDDVLAVDFVGGNWSTPPVGKYLNDNKERLDKALAHLSYERIEFERNKQWLHRIVFEEISEMWGRFWSAVPDNQRFWFRIDTDDE